MPDRLNFTSTDTIDPNALIKMKIRVFDKTRSIANTWTCNYHKSNSHFDLIDRKEHDGLAIAINGGRYF